MNDARENNPADEAMQALTTMRNLWQARGQGDAELAEVTGSTRSCKRMRDIGFGALAGEPEDRDHDAGPAPVRTELRSAWRTQLAREGKLRPGPRGLLDVVDEPAEPRE